MASSLWFISDLHLNHENIIKYAGRPFAHANDMNEALIKNWNDRVRPQDHIYDLGDVAMCRPRHIAHLIKRLNGHKRLIRGNHDIFHTKEYLEAGYEEIYGSRVLDNILFTHIPIHPRSVGRFLANVHGHTHAQPDYDPVLRLQYDTVWEGKEQPTVGMCPYINICVERTGYAPVDLAWIKARIKEKS